MSQDGRTRINEDGDLVITGRPHRHLCPDADRRDAMTDGEFWANVADNLTQPYEPFDDGTEPPEFVSLNLLPCPICGETGACGYDSEGRPMLHAIDDGEDD